MIRRDCIHYHCEHDMGASIDCCTLRGLGNCPCSNDCNDYANKNKIYLLGLDVFRKRKEASAHPKHFRDLTKKVDVISRQAAIGIVEFECGEWRGLAKTIAEEIKLLPSAQPERKTGRWIYDGDCYVCSECRSAYGWWADSQVSNYCPNCGTDMRGEQNEAD